MKFFVPGAESAEQAERVWESIRLHAEHVTGWPVARSRICCLTYNHEGKTYTAEVGKEDPYFGGLVVAIFSSTTFLICTPYRGVVAGSPIMVGKGDGRGIVYFEREHEDAQASS